MKKILIIEDEVSIADLERNYLEVSGFQVVVENTGFTGMARVMKEDFDLIILDLMLPGEDLSLERTTISQSLLVLPAGCKSEGSLEKI
ncbi:MAG: hypothetical protein PWP27_1738 [Clostridiales bacterium]|jgi:DNA-binding response OmpR family regulator|nr:hypothetical protein [Clostridiales bacterium]